ncbi:hypothetical protein BDW75DRAFT_243279 [Aspergillus navahoensis]
MNSNDKLSSGSKSSFSGANGSTFGTNANNSTSSGTSPGNSRPAFDPSLRHAIAIVNGYAKVKAAVEADESTPLTEEEACGVLHALGIQLAPGEDASTKLKSFAKGLAKHRGSSF